MPDREQKESAIRTPVARPMLSKPALTRRTFILGGFWSTLFLAVVGILGAPLDFVWQRRRGRRARRAGCWPSTRSALTWAALSPGGPTSNSRPPQAGSAVPATARPT